MATTESKPHLLFALGGDDYFVATEQVRELVAAAPLTPLPGAPPWVRGVFNLRGAVVPLVDLGRKLGVGSAASTAGTSWLVVELIVERRKHVLAFESEEVREIVALDDAALLPTPPAGIPIRRDCVRGVVLAGDRFRLVLDLERVFLAGESLAGEPGSSG
jgi:purine-binding chemotaxis protein CheW